MVAVIRIMESVVDPPREDTDVVPGVDVAVDEPVAVSGPVIPKVGTSVGAAVGIAVVAEPPQGGKGHQLNEDEDIGLGVGTGVGGPKTMGVPSRLERDCRAGGNAYALEDGRDSEMMSSERRDSACGARRIVKEGGW